MTPSELDQFTKQGKVEAVKDESLSDARQSDAPNFSPLLYGLQYPRKHLTSAPTFIPKNFLEQIQIVDDGTRKLYVYINKAWQDVAASGTPGAPSDAQYVTLAANGTLTGERVLTAGSNITITDGGAGGNVTISATVITAHGSLTGLSNDDHTQYHNDARGDVRYYTKTLLDAGQLDARYYTESETNTLLAAKQPLDSTLTSLAAFNTNGLLTQIAADTFTGRTITGTTNQVNVTNGNGVSGNPTLSLPQDINTGAAVQFDTLGLGLSGYSTAKLALLAGSFGNNPNIAVLNPSGYLVFQVTDIGNVFFGAPPTLSGPDSQNSPGFTLQSTYHDGVNSGADVFSFQSIRLTNSAGGSVLQFRDNSANTVLALGDGNQSASIGYGFPNNPASLGQLHVRSVDSNYPTLVAQGAASQTANLQNWQDSSANVLAAVLKNGAFQPASLADSAAANNSLYYSTTASKLVYKDSGGVVNNLY